EITARKKDSPRELPPVVKSERGSDVWVAWAGWGYTMNPEAMIEVQLYSQGEFTCDVYGARCSHIYELRAFPVMAKVRGGLTHARSAGMGLLGSEAKLPR
ncbi:unnamed protein product, partial [Polarella glacialis]